MRWFLTCSSLAVGGTLLPQPLSKSSWVWDLQEAWLQVFETASLRQITCWILQPPPFLLLPVLPSHLSDWIHFSWSVSYNNVPMESLLVLFCMSCQVLVHLCVGFPDPVSEFTDRIPVFFQATHPYFSDFNIFTSFTSVYPAGPCSFILALDQAACSSPITRSLLLVWSLIFTEKLSTWSLLLLRGSSPQSIHF